MRRTLITMSFALVASCIAMSALAQDTTSMTFDGQPGCYVGVVGHTVYTPTTGSFTFLQNNRGGVTTIYQDQTNSRVWWWVQLCAANDEPLIPGHKYNGVARFSMGPLEQPGLDIFGTGVGCDEVTGWFECRDIAWNSNGTLARLYVVGAESCEGNHPFLNFEIRFNVSQATPTVRDSFGAVKARYR